ncbi:E3 ubiquitin-protein ligase MARCHF3-like isoform X2 [Aphis gossypii]|uniref:E3 ubiquitin-protein ligase MARCHF3-like isoform X2 n=1 Tax=Aphis gossypii TaxID=80765 RepID=UPI002159256D|nr:E3 ubiquitin-protein ligase MARCHF3-like isoform X2 [Aphis gossypii]
MSEALGHILFPDTPTNENQDLYSSARENELSSLINKKVLSETSENKIRTDMLLSTSSGFKDPEIPTPSLCRICLQSDLDESNKCISPCFCRGSISKVHKTCLEKWLLQASSTVCEICTFVYKTKRITKYSLLGSIKAWVFSSENKEEVKELFYDGCVLVIILPFISLFSYVGFSITEHIFNTDVQIKYDMAYRVVSFSACWSIVCADFFFCFWTSCRIQHHVLNWYNFYKNNQSIILESALPEDST